MQSLGVFMRSSFLAILLVAGLATGAASAEDATTMTTLKADQIGQIFCLSRLGNDEAVIEGILTADLKAAIEAASVKDEAYEKQYPGEKPPLGDGIPWQGWPDYAAECTTGLVTLMKTDAKVEINYGFPEDASANFTDTLLLKRVDMPDYGTGFWRIDNIAYGPGGDLKSVLTSAFDNL